MRFQSLLDAAPGLLRRPDADVEISAPISEDSRTVTPGGVFVARPGANVDGHTLIGSAVANGAVAVVGEKPPDQVNCPVPYAQVANAQMALGPLAAAYYGNPSRQLIVIGVTGTDGKTTTTNLIFNILKAAGKKVGMISTVNAVIGDQTLDTGLHVTTPSAPVVQMYLSRMVKAGLTHCVLETTSFGLEQGRVNGVDYDVAVLTNLTHEHLNIHGTFEKYRAAKGLLFNTLSQSYRKPGIAKPPTVTRADPNARYFLSFPADEYYPYGIGVDNLRVGCESPTYGPQGTEFVIRFGYVRLPIKTALVGQFNVENILAAASA